MSILVVDDEKDIRDLVGDILQDEGFSVRLAANANQAMAEVDQNPPALIILDIWLKDSHMDGIEILKAVKRNNPDIPVVVISGHANVEIAVAAIKRGAYDLIEKPFNIDKLMLVVRRALETSRLRRENAELRRREGQDLSLIGTSPAFRALKMQIDKVAKSNGRVMLTGGAGSGKETVARLIHAASTRADMPFISVPSATITPEHMEELLFGRESKERGIEKGLLEQAHGGVIYFDEVADMPAGSQSKLLRVLVEQQFTRVGSTARVRVDLRVMSSTARDLNAEIRDGRFRQELFDRLNVVTVCVPNLDERREDIPLLAAHFVQILHQTQGLVPRALSADSAAVLQAMDWPGNVRQLRNLIERVLILGDANAPVSADEITGETQQIQGQGLSGLGNAIATLPLRDAREVFEREYLLSQVNRFGGNISRTAQFVGMERSALHRKLKLLGIATSARSASLRDDELIADDIES